MKCETTEGVRNKSGVRSEIFRKFRHKLRTFVSVKKGHIMWNFLDSSSVYSAGVTHTIFLL